jgi:hypothetical protein
MKSGPRRRNCWEERRGEGEDGKEEGMDNCPPTDEDAPFDWRI